MKKTKISRYVFWDFSLTVSGLVRDQAVVHDGWTVKLFAKTIAKQLNGSMDKQIKVNG